MRRVRVGREPHERFPIPLRQGVVVCINMPKNRDAGAHRRVKSRQSLLKECSHLYAWHGVVVKALYDVVVHALQRLAAHLVVHIKLLPKSPHNPRSVEPSLGLKSPQTGQNRM